MNKKIFVIMPFEEEFFEMYEMLKMSLGDKYSFSNAAEEDNQQNIMKDIIYPLYDAEVVLADLTGQNSNVMYELGVAHTLGKKTIIITKDNLGMLPFDLRQYRAKQYDVKYKQFAELLDYLDKNFSGAVNNSVVFGNPVLDVLHDKGITNINLKYNTNNVVSNCVDDKGFVDYMADIEEHFDVFNNVINELASDIKEMSDGITECTSKINNVKGDGTASYVRKQSRKVAEYINIFEKKLKVHNDLLHSTWNEIETNTIGLIENPLATKAENRNELLKYLKSLEGIQDNAINSANTFEDIKRMADGLLGLQRNITQAVKYLKEDLNDYIAFVYSLSASIDKIINRSKPMTDEV